MQVFKLLLFADYFQFYIQDEAAKGDLSSSWDDKAVRRGLAVAPGAVGIRTVRNTDVPVHLEIHDAEPEEESSQWYRVMEASLNAASGKIVLAGCTDYFPDAFRVEVPPNVYRVRVSYGRSTPSENGRSGDDHYRAQLWSAPWTEVRMLKPRSIREA